MKKLGYISISLTFFLAGLGMLLQLPVENGNGRFFENVLHERDIWNFSHIILLLSTALMMPAGISMVSNIYSKKSRIIALACVIFLAPTSIFLAGQYAIDFVAPISASIGGDAIQAYNQIDNTMPTSILFYGLSNLSILLLMIISLIWVWNGSLSISNKVLITVNWLFVLIGNLIDPMFQRSMILLLSFTLYLNYKNQYRGD